MSTFLHMIRQIASSNGRRVPLSVMSTPLICAACSATIDPFLFPIEADIMPLFRQTLPKDCLAHFQTVFKPTGSDEKTGVMPIKEPNMSKVCAFIADGFEEVECLSVVDILRRAKVTVQLVSVSGSLEVTGSHQIRVIADILLQDADFSDCDVLFLPGGVPGVPNLAKSEALAALLCRFAREGKRLSAICAAPSILGDLNLLNGVTATCYPGWESHLHGAVLSPLGVVTDGQFTTARGMGFGVDLGLELVSILCSPELSLEIKKGIQHPAV